MAKKNRSTRKNRKTMKGGENTPAAPAAAPAPAAPPAPAAAPAAVNTGKLLGGKRRSRKLSPGAQKWRQHVMKTFKDLRAKDRNATFSQALKTAGKSYRRG